MAEQQASTNDILLDIRRPTSSQTDSDLLRSLKDCEDLSEEDLLKAFEAAHKVYARAIEDHVQALEAERRKLGQAARQQRQELAKVEDRGRRAASFDAEEKAEFIRTVMLQRKRLEEETKKLGER